MSERPAAVKLQLVPPGETESHDIEVDLLSFTLAERNIAKKALAQLTDPDLLEVMAVNAWVVWRRSHPDCKLDAWFDSVTFGDLLGTHLDTIADQPILTPDEYDPELSGTG